MITPLRRSGMARNYATKGSQFYLHTPHSSANGMNHTRWQQRTLNAEAGQREVGK